MIFARIIHYFSPQKSRNNCFSGGTDLWPWGLISMFSCIRCFNNVYLQVFCSVWMFNLVVVLDYLHSLLLPHSVDQQFLDNLSLVWLMAAVVGFYIESLMFAIFSAVWCHGGTNLASMKTRGGLTPFRMLCTMVYWLLHARLRGLVKNRVHPQLAWLVASG